MKRTADRFPWPWTILVIVCSIVAVVFTLHVANERIDEARQQVLDSQVQELHAVHQNLGDYLADAFQLATATASIANSVRGDRPLVKRLLRGLALSHVNRSVYGIGAFYAPDVFDRQSHRFDPFWALLPNFRYSVDTDATYDYTKLKWYKAAVRWKGTPQLYGPFFDSGMNFISVVQAFYENRKLAGVALEVISVRDFLHVMRSGLKPGDVAYLVTVSKHAKLFTSNVKVGNWMDLSTTIPYSGARLHVASNPAGFNAQKNRIYDRAAVTIAGILVATVFVFAGLIRLWRSHVLNLDMELELELRDDVERRLREVANTDQLTGLPNRRYLLQRLGQIFTEGVEQYALVFVDLDRFNVTNDTLGHDAGDELLSRVATNLKNALPPGGEVTRLGGDEFVVLAPASDASEAVTVATQMLDALSDPFSLQGQNIYVSASAGILLVDATYKSPADALRDVDIAMYEAKRRGRARYAVFSPSMRDRVEQESVLDHDLRLALVRGEFVAYYQPIVELSTMTVTSAEILARWNRPMRGLASANDFIPHAEARGLIDAIDTAMLVHACDSARSFRDRFPGASLSVNFSAAHLLQPGLAESVLALLRENSVEPASIKVEITETAIMSDSTDVLRAVERLRDGGVEIVVDDFGVGHSSLAYLRRLPISGLKIDRTFVDPLPDDAQAVAIVRSIMVLAQTLGLYTVAEGVETAEQAAMLTELGVTYAQGYYFARPMPLEALLSFELLI